MGVELGYGEWEGSTSDRERVSGLTRAMWKITKLAEIVNEHSSPTHVREVLENIAIMAKDAFDSYGARHEQQGGKYLYR